MKGGFNNPPNVQVDPVIAPPDATSMKGGFNNPPNGPLGGVGVSLHVTSMKGGFNNPPELDELIDGEGSIVVLQ